MTFESKTLLRDRLFLFSFAVLVSLAASDNALAESITTPRSHVTYELGTLQGERMIVANPGDQRTWVYHDRRLRAYDKSGKRVVDRLHITLPKNQVAVALLANENAIWLAVDRQLIKFDMDGQIILQKYFNKSIHGLAYDVKSAQLLVSTTKQVFVLDHEGEEIDRIRMILPYIA